MLSVRISLFEIKIRNETLVVMKSQTTNIQTVRETDTVWQTNKQTNKQKNKQTNKQTNKQETELARYGLWKVLYHIFFKRLLNICFRVNFNYNIASRAAQSNSVYVSVLKIPVVHADSVSKSLRQKFFFRASGHCYIGEKYYISRQ